MRGCLRWQADSGQCDHLTPQNQCSASTERVIGGALIHSSETPENRRTNSNYGMAGERGFEPLIG